MNAAIEKHRSTIHRSEHFTPAQITHMKEVATKQERAIARWFYNHPNETIGPGRLHEQEGFAWPVTSTRRAISNLTEAGILTKTNKQSAGVFGRPEHHWQWKRPTGAPEQKSLF